MGAPRISAYSAPLFGMGIRISMPDVFVLLWHLHCNVHLSIHALPIKLVFVGEAGIANRKESKPPIRESFMSHKRVHQWSCNEPGCGVVVEREDWGLPINWALKRVRNIGEPGYQPIQHSCAAHPHPKSEGYEMPARKV